MNTIICTVAGAACGALAGGFAAGLAAWRDTPPGGAMLPRSGWVLVGLWVGGLYGVVPGVVIGLLVGLTGAGQLFGALIGLTVGVVIAGVLFGMATQWDEPAGTCALLSPPLAALIGFVVSTLASRRLW